MLGTVRLDPAVTWGEGGRTAIIFSVLGAGRRGAGMGSEGGSKVPWRADRDPGVGVGKDAVRLGACWWLDTGQWRDRGSRARRRLYEPFEPLGSSQADELSRFQAWSDPGPLGANE